MPLELTSQLNNQWTLIVDTSQPWLLMGLWDGQNQLLGSTEQTTVMANQHASRFFGLMEDLCQQASIKPNQISNLAINTGPGSFTGLRVGLSFAKIWQQFFKPNTGKLFSLDTFSLFAACPSIQNQRVKILLNAYRQRHYMAQLTSASTGINWSAAPEIIENTLYSPPEKETKLIVEKSLLPLLNLNSDNNAIILTETLQSEMLLAFKELLSSAPNVFLHDCKTHIEAKYLQQPHITVSKKTTLTSP